MSDRRVVQKPGGGWDVETPDGETTAEDRRSPRRAMVQARAEIRATGGGELILADRRGRVRQRDVVDPPAAPARPGPTDEDDRGR